jgi:hypothetical protein
MKTDINFDQHDNTDLPEEESDRLSDEDYYDLEADLDAQEGMDKDK